MEEIWKDIPTMEGYYQASNIGRVRSLSRRVNTTFGVRSTRPVILKTCFSTLYPSVSICIQNKRKTRNIHQLMAMAFYGHNPKLSKLVINHIDGNGQNNILRNIELVTLRYNTSDGRKRMKTTSNYTGVSLNKAGQWKSMICLNYIDYDLGLFNDELLAANAYNIALNHIENGDFIEWYKSYPPSERCTSKYRGVCFVASRNKWIARLVIAKKLVHQSRHNSEMDAAIAYKNAVDQYWNTQTKYLYPKRGLIIYQKLDVIKLA